MTSFGSSLTAPSSGLTAANINTLIQQTLAAQRQPITDLTARKDTLNIEKAVYSDLKSKLSTFRGVIENLMSGDADTVFDDIAVTSSDTDVVTATATSSAASGNYTIDVTALAKAHRVRSDQATSNAETLNLNGTFTLNGADVTVESGDSLEDIMDAINAAEYGELLFDVGSGYESDLANGIVSSDLRDEFATNGITLSADATVSTEVDGSRWLITDHGETYSVRKGETGLDIHEGGKGVTATIVDNHLVLEADSTGASNAITASGDVLAGSISAGTGLGILTAPDTFNHAALQTAADASFTVNGIAITRSSNMGLDDVINGVTLNLLSEEEAELEVSQDRAAVSAKINAFATNLNSITSYLKAKTKTTVDQENGVYTRGALSGKTIFSTLKTNLIAALSEEVSAGSLQGLKDIGITVGTGLEVSLDTAELNSALESNFSDVVQLFDGVMENYLSILEPFTIETSSSNTLDLYSNSVETRMENIDNRIERMETALLNKEEALIKQYSGLYMQSINIQNQQQGLFSLYAGFSAYG